MTPVLQQMSGTDAAQEKPSTLRKTFDQFVGQTFYGQMFKAMRSTLGKPAYMHGGRAEEIFTTQFDQLIADKMSAAHAHELTGPMFEQLQQQLDTLPRK